jgi:hypothetical protein
MFGDLKVQEISQPSAGAAKTLVGPQDFQEPKGDMEATSDCFPNLDTTQAPGVNIQLRQVIGTSNGRLR